MKKILIVWIGLLLIFLVGCSKNKLQREEAKETKKVAEITVDKCSIYTSPDSSSSILNNSQREKLEFAKLLIYRV